MVLLWYQLPEYYIVNIMISILLNGFLSGLILQIAIGPVFFFILNISLQNTGIDGFCAVFAVTIVDDIVIARAGVGVGRRGV